MTGAACAHFDARTAQERRSRIKGRQSSGKATILTQSLGLVADYLTMLRIKLALLVSIFCACLLLANAADSPQVIRYTIASNGKVAGGEVDTYYPDGRIRAHSSSTIAAADRRFRRSISSTRAASRARRRDRQRLLRRPQSTNISKSKTARRPGTALQKRKAPAGAFYVSNNGPSAEVALMVAAYEKSERRTHAALPFRRRPPRTNDRPHAGRPRPKDTRRGVRNHRAVIRAADCMAR